MRRNSDNNGCDANRESTKKIKNDITTHIYKKNKLDLYKRKPQKGKEYICLYKKNNL